MTGTRVTLPFLVAVVLVTPADAGTIFGRKPKTEAQVKRLIDGLRTEADDKKRRTAIAELRDADPRTNTDVIPALVSALQRDPSPQVRADAAEAIGQFKIVFGLAGLALETAAESDPSRAVRDSAQQALWEYYLSGYRSARGAGGIAGQTVEPPIARPAAPRRPVEVVPAAGAHTAAPLSSLAPVAPPPLKPAAGGTPPPPVPGLPAYAVSVSHSPIKPTGLEPPAGLDPLSGLRILLTVAPPPQMNVTSEPPVAPPPEYPLAPPPTPVAAAAAGGDVSENSTHPADVVISTGLAPTGEPPFELTDLPPVSLPPTDDRPADPIPPAPQVSRNEYGPRVDYPAARMITGTRRFKTPE